MISKDDLEQILQKYFSEYSSNHLYVLIGFFLITIIFQISQAIYVSNKIEKFKNELKKSEIKFSRFNTLQIDALKLIYDKAVTFHYMNYRLFYPKTYSHASLKAKVENWKTEFVNIMDILHRERILLPPEVEKTVKDFDTQLKKISEYLDIEVQSLLSFEEYEGTDDPQILYQTSDAEVDAMKLRIGKLLNYDEIKNSETLINNFRKKIEEYFANLIN